MIRTLALAGAALVLTGLATARINAEDDGGGRKAASDNGRFASRASAPESSDVTIRVTPSIARSPAVVRALVQVPRHADNRRLRVTLESSGYYRSSTIQLDGDEAPRSHFFTFQSLPAGDYALFVELYGSTQLRSPIVQRSLRVLGFD